MNIPAMPKPWWAVAALVVLSLALAATVAVLCARLDTAREKLAREAVAHNATRAAYTRDVALWLHSQRAANATIAGLQGQADALFSARELDRAAEIDRCEIMRNATTSCVAQPAGVVDDATSRAAVRHINDAFQRLR